MNGPEHYQAAEILLGRAEDTNQSAEQQRTFCFAAQVHATLALAAATASRHAAPSSNGAWLEALR